MNFSTGQKGFGLGKAAVGGLLLGPVGLLGGMLGRKKMELVCQACGKKWKPDPKDFA
jgi:tellurium resistance protein TerD